MSGACVRRTHAYTSRSKHRRDGGFSYNPLSSSLLSSSLLPAMPLQSRCATLNAAIEQRANPSGAETKSHGPDPGEFTDTNKQQAPASSRITGNRRSFASDALYQRSSSWKIDR